MNFSELKNNNRVFIDANIFIYNFTGLSRECKNLLLKCENEEIKGYTSTSILAEVLHRLMIAEAIEKGYISEKNPVKKLKEQPEVIKNLSTYNICVDKIFDMNINIIDLSSEIFRSSAHIRNSDYLLVNDSLVVSAMKYFEITNLATNDYDFDKIEWIKVYKPSDL